MSFRRFVYYCAVCGAWFAFLGWTAGILLSWALTGVLVSDDSPRLRDLLHAADLGLFLGMSVAVGLSALDALWNVPLRQVGQWALRIVCALVVGGFGGLVGAAVGQLLFGLTQFSPLFFFGWTIIGLLVGASVASFDVARGFFHPKTMPTAFKKLAKCTLGGTVGGMLGGGIAFVLREVPALVFTDRDTNRFLSPTALGFVALGACIGLLVGLAQVLLREAWVRVEAGFRPGREMLLSKEKTSVGRAEGTDIPLFGDDGVEKLHAQILLDAGRFYLEETGPTQGTFVNDRKVQGRVPLASGDLIRMGKSLLRFNERRKRAAA